LIGACPFPELEVIKISHPYMRTSSQRLRLKLRLQKLKKLNLKGCAVQLDETTAVASKSV